MTFSERLKSLGLDSYDAYLCGTHWQDFKERYRTSGNSIRCAVCKCTNFELHHQSYARLGEERFDDVVPLCPVHHDKVHELLGSKGVECTAWAIGILTKTKEVIVITHPDQTKPWWPNGGGKRRKGEPRNYRGPRIKRR